MSSVRANDLPIGPEGQLLIDVRAMELWLQDELRRVIYAVDVPPKPVRIPFGSSIGKYHGCKDTPDTWNAIEAERAQAEREAYERGDAFYVSPIYWSTAWDAP